MMIDGGFQVIERYLPVECYSTSAGYLKPMEGHAGIVLHYFSARYADTKQPYDMEVCWQLFRDINFHIGERRYGLYEGPRIKASAHFLVGKESEVWQLAPLDYQAFHAGHGEWRGISPNRQMIGIEMVGSSRVDYPAEQIWAVAQLSKWLMRKYFIKSKSIVGHSDVDPKRKKDPGPRWDWVIYREMLED